MRFRTSRRPFLPSIRMSLTAEIAPIFLALSTLSTTAVIHYSLGTSIPGTNSPIYSGPIFLTNTAHVRARAFETGLFPGPIHSESYVSLATNALNFVSDLPVMILHNNNGG